MGHMDDIDLYIAGCADCGRDISSDDILCADCEMRVDSGYCVHGTYVGGCGIDWMCGWCEDGVSLEEYKLYWLRDRVARMIRREEIKMRLYLILIENAVDISDIPGMISNVMRFQ